MSIGREAVNAHVGYVDPTPMPSDIPDVPEVGATSAPLKSAAYYIGARCQPYNDDFMLCKQESRGQGEIDCLKEGRRVTRCAISVLEDINKHCLKEFQLHWKCLEQQNHEYSGCRPAEKLLSKCVFDNLKLEKKIPGTPQGETPIHLREKRYYKPNTEDVASVKAFNEAKSKGLL
uniref:NADH-ubiquinone oxidoreductase n=1 Tax=Blastobotrys adeninivorans TaxID=409370 RepID=A0A060SWX7_BLAAD